MSKEVSQFLSELITLQLAAVVHPEAPNRAIHHCIKRRLPQLRDYPLTRGSLKELLRVVLPLAEIDRLYKEFGIHPTSVINFGE